MDSIGGHRHNAKKDDVTYLPLNRHGADIRRRADERVREAIARIDEHIERHRAEAQRHPRISSVLRPRLF